MKLVIFKILDKEYALDVKSVIQVVRSRPIIPIPQSLDFVEGVIAWQGKVIPLINLRKKFMLGDAQSSLRSRFIILKFNQHSMGIIVDSVTEVLNIDQASIEQVDEVLKEATYLMGVLKSAQRIILLMDAEKLFSGEEKQNISAMHARVAVRGHA